MLTQAERLAALEERQKGHEEKVKVELANFSEAIERTEKVAEEAKELAGQVASSVDSMPGKIIEAMEKKRKEKRLEGKDWILFGFSALTLLALFGDKFGLFK
jgi:hypothetical protein